MILGIIIYIVVILVVGILSYKKGKHFGQYDGYDVGYKDGYIRGRVEGAQAIRSEIAESNAINASFSRHSGTKNSPLKKSGKKVVIKKRK